MSSKYIIFGKLMGIKEASEMWGLSQAQLKQICAKRLVICRKIGNSWVILKDQPNPKRIERKKGES